MYDWTNDKWRESLANWKTSQWWFYFSDLLAEIVFKENTGSLSHVNLTKSMVIHLLPDMVKALRNIRKLSKFYTSYKYANKLHLQ